ncbi:hypothetical protein L210DRAFT_3455095, partial [Boletus edulis BED1]
MSAATAQSSGSSGGCAARSFPHSPGPMFSHPDHQTAVPHSESSQKRKSSSCEDRRSSQLSVLRYSPPRGPSASAADHRLLDNGLLYSPPPVFHLPKHLPFRNVDTRSLETAPSPNLRLPDPFDQRGVRSLFASMSRCLLI